MTTDVDLYRGRPVTVEGHGNGNVIQAEGDWVRVEIENGPSIATTMSKITLRD